MTMRRPDAGWSRMMSARYLGEERIDPRAALPQRPAQDPPRMRAPAPGRQRDPAEPRDRLLVQLSHPLLCPLRRRQMLSSPGPPSAGRAGRPDAPPRPSAGRARHAARSGRPMPRPGPGASRPPPDGPSTRRATCTDGPTRLCGPAAPSPRARAGHGGWAASTVSSSSRRAALGRLSRSARLRLLGIVVLASAVALQLRCALVVDGATPRARAICACVRPACGRC